MTSVVYVNHKGYCMPDEPIEPNKDVVVTNGLQELPWDLYLPEDADDEDRENNEKSKSPTPTSPPKKLSKLEKEKLDN